MSIGLSICLYVKIAAKLPRNCCHFLPPRPLQALNESGWCGELITASYFLIPCAFSEAPAMKNQALPL